MTLNNVALMIESEPRLVVVIRSVFMDDLRDKFGYTTLKNEGEIPSESCRSRQAPIDPFTQKLNMTTWDILKVAINTLWLVPLRLILFVIPTVLVGLLISFIAGVREESTRPLRGWKKFLIHRFGTFLNRILLFGVGFYWIKVTGKPASSQDAPIKVAAPHSSFFDVLLLSLPSVPAFVTKASNRNLPIFGRLFDQTMKCIFVSRLDPQSRQQCKDEITRRVNSEDEWPPVLIFAEGTTTNRKAIIQFKLGAFKPNVPVQPVVIKYKNKLNTMVWADNGVHVLMSLYLTLCQLNNHAEMVYLPVYQPSEEEKENPQLFADNVRNVMAQSCDVPTSEHTFEDVLLARKAKSLGMPYASGIVEYGRTIKPFQVSVDQMKKLLRRFAQIDRNKDGLISVEDLAYFLRVHQDACFNALFDKLDTSNTGLISFCKYANGLLRLSKPLLDTEDFFHSIFNFLDHDGDGLISRDDLFELPLVKGHNNSCSYSNLYDVIFEGNNNQFFHWRCNRCTPPHSACQGSGEAEEGEEGSSVVVIPLMDMAGPWNYDQFKLLIEDNLDYLLLFHDCQNADLSSQQPPPV